MLTGHQVTWNSPLLLIALLPWRRNWHLTLLPVGKRVLVNSFLQPNEALLELY